MIWPSRTTAFGSGDSGTDSFHSSSCQSVRSSSVVEGVRGGQVSASSSRSLSVLSGELRLGEVRLFLAGRVEYAASFVKSGFLDLWGFPVRKFRASWAIFRKSGRIVARQPAEMPRANSMDDHMVRLIASL
jgi:hypothetical protein